MEGHVQEEGRLSACHGRQEVPDKKLDMSDIPAYRVDGIILLSLSILKRINILRPNMLLANDAGCYVLLHQDVAEAMHLVMGVEVVHVMVQTVHPILIDRQAW